MEKIGSGVKRFFQSEVGAAVFWVLSALVLAAMISPWVYQGGKYFATVAAAQDLPAVLEWVGAACGRSKFSRFFNRSMLFSALILLPWLWWRIRWLRTTGETPALARTTRVSWRTAALQIALGCVIAGGMLGVLGASLDAAGVFVPKATTVSLDQGLMKIFVPAVGASLLEEWLFRGLLLGLWLRFARPVTACMGTALLFAFLHFLEPADGAIIVDPTHALAGFVLLGKILHHLTQPLFFVTDFATLAVCGLILAWGRVRTGALWFSIGLHAGWVMLFKGFNLFYQLVPQHAIHPWGVGENLRSGVLPLITLGVTALLSHWALRIFSMGRSSG
jgi:membrane protease YdiL (CAAX protease family)